MNIEQFKNSTSGKVLRFGEGEAAYFAFIPNPLPPDFVFTPELVMLLSESDRALGELAGLSRMLPNPNILIHPLIRKEAVNSSKIEGTQAELTDLYGYEAGQLTLPGVKPPRPASELKEVSNYVTALNYALQRVHSLPVSLRLIREIHSYLMKDVRGDKATPGEFRRTQNWIGSPGCLINEASYVPPPVLEMHTSLNYFEEFIHENNLFPPLINLAFIHYQFEAIHPFLDGNGRIGRLLISLLLVEKGLLPQPLLYLSSFFENNREEYLFRLSEVSNKGSWMQWVSFFLGAVFEQARETICIVRDLLELQDIWKTTLARLGQSALPLRLADMLFEEPVLTIPTAQHLLGVKTYHSARSAVNRLAEIGALHPAGEGPQGKVFAAMDIFRIVEGREKEEQWRNRR